MYLIVTTCYNFYIFIKEKKGKYLLNKLSLIIIYYIMYVIVTSCYHFYIFIKEKKRKIFVK